MTLAWFVMLAGACGLAWYAAVLCAGRSSSAGRVTLGIGLVLMAVWLVLQRSPAVSTRVLPASWLVVLEGTLAAPLFMVIVGALWARAHQRREQQVALAATLLGVVYLVHGGGWMLRQTPRVGFAGEDQAIVVRQSTDYSCVPAACATAARWLGVPASEAEMAALTHTRPGSGSTLLRAMWGMQRKLGPHGVRCAIVQPTDEELYGLPMPAMTAVRADVTQLHMVTLLRVDDEGVLIADPAVGMVQWTWAEYAAAKTGPVLVFERSG